MANMVQYPLSMNKNVSCTLRSYDSSLGLGQRDLSKTSTLMDYDK